MIDLFSAMMFFDPFNSWNQFQSRLTESDNQDTSSMLLSVIDDEDER